MSAADFWNEQAAGFDDEPDHGLADPAVRRAWRALLQAHLPAAPSDVVDLGCGTGSLAVLAAQLGHRVRGLDVADRMVGAARAKAVAAGVEVELLVGDAARPPYAAGSADVVLCRHVLWAVPDPREALVRWEALLRPGGRMVLVEGRWHTGAGLAAAEVMEALSALGRRPEVLVLDDPAYWGGPVDDERYVVLA